MYKFIIYCAHDNVVQDYFWFFNLFSHKSHGNVRPSRFAMCSS